MQKFKKFTKKLGKKQKPKKVLTHLKDIALIAKSSERPINIKEHYM